jgi:hypothetical protein
MKRMAVTDSISGARKALLTHKGVTIYYTDYDGCVSDYHYATQPGCFSDDDDTFDIRDLKDAGDGSDAALLRAAIDRGEITADGWSG